MAFFSRKVWSLLAGLFFISGGLALVLVSYYRKQQNTSIEVIGNQSIPAQEIKEMVSFYYKLYGKNFPTEKLAQALEIAPRIKKVKIQRQGKKLLIQLQEEDSAFLWQSSTSVLEFSSGFKLLQEEWLASNYPLPFSMPIFYLTAQDKSEKVVRIMSHLMEKPLLKKSLQEFVSLYQKTKKSYAFLWERMSEIILIEKKGQVFLEIYLSNTPTKLFVPAPVDASFLARFWAIAAYVETKLPYKKLWIHMDDKHAIIREL